VSKGAWERGDKPYLELSARLLNCLTEGPLLSRAQKTHVHKSCAKLIRVFLQPPRHDAPGVGGGRRNGERGGRGHGHDRTGGPSQRLITKDGVDRFAGDGSGCRGRRGVAECWGYAVVSEVVETDVDDPLADRGLDGVVGSDKLSEAVHGR